MGKIKRAINKITGNNEPTMEKPAGMAGKIDKYQVQKAAELARNYQTYKSNAEARIKNNELYIRARQWDADEYIKKYPDEPDPTSSWLFNAMANKHADFMDNYPEASILPREESDAPTAKKLSSILPVVLERANFEKAYSQVAWDIQLGAGVFGVFWDNTLENGLGDISIQAIDIMNIFWEPGIEDIQDSRHVFRCEMVDNEILENKYPELKNKTGKSGLTVTEYDTDDTVPKNEKSLVYHWYYKIQDGTKKILHYCQFVGDTVLFSSENAKDDEGKPLYPDGYYWHGKYPFTVVSMYPQKQSIVGYGTVDIGKRAQRDIDLLNKAMIRNAQLSSMPRIAYREGAGVNMEQFFDFTTPGFEVTNSADLNNTIKEFNIRPLDGSTLSYHAKRIDELKEVTGNRDFSQGGVTGGVTAASAITALQEAGSKLARAQIKTLYRATKDVYYMCIELIRQFYTLPRQFRIVGNQGAEEYIAFSALDMQKSTSEGDLGTDETARLPIFDIKVKVHRANPYSRMQQNAQAMEFYSAGFFNPQNATMALAALKMIDIEGKDEIEKTIAENGEMYEQLQMLSARLQEVMADNVRLAQANNDRNNIQPQKEQI